MGKSLWIVWKHNTREFDHDVESDTYKKTSAIVSVHKNRRDARTACNEQNKRVGSPKITNQDITTTTFDLLNDDGGLTNIDCGSCAFCCTRIKSKKNIEKIFVLKTYEDCLDSFGDSWVFVYQNYKDVIKEAKATHWREYHGSEEDDTDEFMTSLKTTNHGEFYSGSGYIVCNIAKINV